MEAKAEHAGQDVTLAIIAGGGGHRLGGVAKGLLTLEGRPLIERILDLRPRFSEVLLVADNPGAYKAYGLRSVPDLVEGRGAPGGVHAARGVPLQPGPVLGGVPGQKPIIWRHFLRISNAGAAQVAASGSRSGPPVRGEYQRPR